jgi:POT family proton-dependent oligopeptide transporter
MNQPSKSSLTDSPTLFGHPAGLFALFFAEMWERFSYYGMRALLLFYMAKGFLGYGDTDAYAVYGAYTALVYMTPFFGGLLADRLLGQRRAVIFGGVLMALGHLLMGMDWNFSITLGGHSILLVERRTAFFTALALLICGNGFFKPNISTIVGSLYGHGNPRRDGGFTIFYMGVNLGAAIAPLLCGYIGERYNWHLGFGLATIGMLVGTAIFVAPRAATQILIFLTSFSAAGALLVFHPANFLSVGMNVFVAAALCVSGVVAILALGRGGVPSEAGAPPDPEYLAQRVLGPINRAWMVYLGTLLAIALFWLLVSGFAPLREDGRPCSMISQATLNSIESSESAAVRSFGVIAKAISRPAGIVLFIAGPLAVAYVLFEMVRLQRVARHRMYVVLILTFFSMVFWTFFEQAGSSINNFTDRNVNRVVGVTRTITAEDVGQTLAIEPTQEQLGYAWSGHVAVTEDDVGKTISVMPTEKQVGYHNADEVFSADTLARLRGGHAGSPGFEIDWVVTKDDVGMQYQRRVFTLDVLNKLRAENKNVPEFTINWLVAKENIGMRVAPLSAEIPASEYQSVNAVCILIFGLAFTALWGFLAVRGLEPSTPVKFAMGLLQLGLGFAVLWYGAQVADSRGMVAMSWLCLAYLLHTTAELCLSPVGLSMITKLSPLRLVSTMMGTWFLATAYSQFLASIVAQFTDVTKGANLSIPPPSETVHVYGRVWGVITLVTVCSAVICFALSRQLTRWMHAEADDESPATAGGH